MLNWRQRTIASAIGILALVTVHRDERPPHVARALTLLETLKRAAAGLWARLVY
jgi:hypothetical protein